MYLSTRSILCSGDEVGIAVLSTQELPPQKQTNIQTKRCDMKAKHAWEWAGREGVVAKEIQR